MRLHLIETVQEIHPVNREIGLFSSGDWRITERRARQLIGHEVYFHKTQRSLSHFGGLICGYEVLPEEHESAGRVVLRFRLMDYRAGKGVDASQAPWGREKAFVRDVFEPMPRHAEYPAWRASV